MTTATTNNNARLPRKSLASQIDRLDTLLDGFADALNESVTAAVKDVVGEVVREAVEAAVKECETAVAKVAQAHEALSHCWACCLEKVRITRRSR